MELTRRELLRQGARAGLCMPLASSALRHVIGPPKQKAAPFMPLAGQLPLLPEDDALLEDLESRNFRYFWEQANPNTGVVRDRCNVVKPDKSSRGSIAALGFGLTALCIGEKRGYVSRPEAEGRVLNSLRFLWKKLPTHRGFFYHWTNVESGERLWDSEVSSVDTAILLCGILTCRQHFQHSEISELAHLIFDRVDWTWLSEDTRILSHG